MHRTNNWRTLSTDLYKCAVTNDSSQAHFSVERKAAWIFHVGMTVSYTRETFPWKVIISAFQSGSLFRDPCYLFHVLLTGHLKSLTGFEGTVIFSKSFLWRDDIHKHMPGNYSRKTSFPLSLPPRMNGFLWVTLCSTRPSSISWRLIPQCHSKVSKGKRNSYYGFTASQQVSEKTTLSFQPRLLYLLFSSAACSQATSVPCRLQKCRKRGEKSPEGH